MVKSTEQQPKRLRPNGHRAPGNRYYITIFGTAEQLFSIFYRGCRSAALLAPAAA
jgi:hypothetical protein